MKVSDLIERLREEDPNTDVYFGVWSEPHNRDSFTPIKLALEPIRKDSTGRPYPLLTQATTQVPTGDTVPIPNMALIIRKDFFYGKV